MAVLAENNGIKLWFGTLERRGWFPTPLQGADTSPQSWGADGTLLNGGGYALGSWGSHKVYQFEWSNASAREVAQKMKSYADGSYGRGLLYFQDPLTYTTNVLPARLADPSMAVGDEGASLVYGVQPTALPTSSNVNELPVNGAFYDLASVSAGFRGVEDATFVVIPEGYTLFLGAFYTASGSGGVFASPQNNNGTVGAPVRLSELAPNSPEVVVDSFSGVAGVWLSVGKSAAGAGSVTFRGSIGRLIKTEFVSDPVRLAQVKQGPWVGGQGHSGARMVGKPTYINNTGTNGGQVGFAATFREVGSWSNG